MAELSAKRGVKKAVEERVKSGKCLIQTCSGQAKQRGLCIRCVQQFYNRRKSLGSETARIRFENDCIREGLILRPGQQDRIIARDPFSEIANQAG